MGSYILNFAVYTMAMCGLIVFALFVYKKFSAGDFGIRNSNFLSIEDTMTLAPRKVLYIIRAGRERFLVASDADKTTLISKLEDNNSSSSTADFNSELAAANTVYNPVNTAKKVNTVVQPVSKLKTAEDLPPADKSLSGIDELPDITTFPKPEKKSNNVLKSMVSKIK